ncbi:MAG TPA: O-methyltransferase [Gemmatimonadaceae bacterium]|nr:O-methyltransferase [Gemmatimonadaceae bacterium]
MTQDLWTRVDRYVGELLIAPDATLDAALRDSDAAGLPPIAVSPAYGRMLQLLARGMGARRVLEIGTLGGYSAIWLARALPPGGRLVTLELNPRHAAVARRNVDRAGVGDRVEIRVGPAQESLRALAREGGAPFDFVFIDADKVGYADYFRLSLPLCRTGAMLVADNIVREGEVANASSADANVVAVRHFNEVVAAEPRVSATVIQTVGVKKYDGFLLAVVTS